MVLQESGEMYLETILVLSQKSKFVRAIDVGEEMGFSRPSVSRAVHLLAEGMGAYYKPGGSDFDFCSKGRMLLLSPFAPRPPHAPRANYGKARFEWLNLAARAIGDLSAGFSRAQLQGKQQLSTWHNSNQGENS